MPGCSGAMVTSAPAWLVYASSPRVQPPSCPGSVTGGGGDAVGEVPAGAVTATLSRFTLQPSPAAQIVPTVFVPAFSCTAAVAVDHESQPAVPGSVNWPTMVLLTCTLSVRVCVPPFAYLTCIS